MFVFAKMPCCISHKADTFKHYLSLRYSMEKEFIMFALTDQQISRGCKTLWQVSLNLCYGASDGIQF